MRTKEVSRGEIKSWVRFKGTTGGQESWRDIEEILLFVAQVWEGSDKGRK